jgi:hypothetical protein
MKKQQLIINPIEWVNLLRFLINESWRNHERFSSVIIAKKKTIFLFKLERKDKKLSKNTDPLYYIVGQAVNLCTDT